MSKREILQANGTYNKNYEKIKNHKFITGSFYDPMDIVQVKYEMLKDAEEGNRGIAQVADEFGFSRASFYNTKDEFNEQGLSAFVPEKPGPRRPYKLTDSYKDYVDRYISENPKASSNEIARSLKKDKGIDISKRTVERYRRKKNTPELINNYPAFSKEIEYIYNALAGDAGTDDRLDDNRDIFLGRGMPEWLYIFNRKQPGPGVSGKVFRMKPADCINR